MAPVNLEKVSSVFHLFAVDNPDALADTAAVAGGISERYIPVHFLPVAAREAGYYPTSSAIHRFTTTVEEAAAGVVTFAAFLQFCEDVAHTNDPGRSFIYKLVEGMSPSGCGFVSSRDLFLILTNGSVNITEGEINAIMELLDPMSRGHILLSNVALVLIEACERQQHSAARSRVQSKNSLQQRQGKELPVSSTGLSKKHSQTFGSTGKPTATATSRPNSLASTLQQQQQKCGHATLPSRARQTSAQPEDRKRQAKKGAGAVKRGDGLLSPEGAPKREGTQSESYDSSSAADIRHDLYSTHREMGLISTELSERHGGLLKQEDTLGCTQTTIIVDLDAQPLIHQPTATVQRQVLSSNSASSASQIPDDPRRSAASATAAVAAPLHVGAEEDSKRHFYHGQSAETHVGARCEVGSRKPRLAPDVYLKLDPIASDQTISTGSGQSSVLRRTTATKEKVIKCCIML